MYKMYKILTNHDGVLCIECDNENIAYGYYSPGDQCWLGYLNHDDEEVQQRIAADTEEQLIFKLKLLVIDIGHDESILDIEYPTEEARL